MRSFLSIVAAPVLCLGVLGGIALENTRHTKPQDADPFHRQAAAAIEAWPRRAGDWVGSDVELPAAAIQLLKPNAHFCRRYVTTNAREQNRRPVSLLVVQCRDPIDMSGHYPPNCYPNGGQPMVYSARREWAVPGVPDKVRGMEYHFESGSMLRPNRTVVYNFFVLPGKGVVPDMDEVRAASGNYQRRHYGAAQIQVVFDDDQGNGTGNPAWRDEVFRTLIGANPSVISSLNPGKI